MNTVWLIIVLYHSGYNTGMAMEKIQIPQANMQQCQINKNAYSKEKDKMIIRSYCIAGVK